MLKVEFGDETQKLIYQISNLSTTLTDIDLHVTFFANQSNM